MSTASVTAPRLADRRTIRRAARPGLSRGARERKDRADGRAQAASRSRFVAKPIASSVIMSRTATLVACSVTTRV